MEKDKHKDSGRAVENYSTYIEKDKHQDRGRRAELFTAEGRELNRDTFIARSKAEHDPRAWTIIGVNRNGIQLSCNPFSTSS